MTLQELLAEYARLSQANQAAWDEVFGEWAKQAAQQEQFFNQNHWQANQQAYDPYQGFNAGQQNQQQHQQVHGEWYHVNVDEYLRSMDMPSRPVATMPVDTETRKREINSELDIIRGRVPTPKGYTVNPGRVKDLMAELKQLNEK